MNTPRPGNTVGIHAGGNIGDLNNVSNVGQISDSFNTTTPAREAEAAATAQPRADIGVLTVLSEETNAVVALFRHADAFRTVERDGSPVHEATFSTPAGPVDAVLLQTVGRGVRSAGIAARNLRAWYRPSTVALVGIAGGISGRLDVGDVVLADQVIYYDERRVSAGGTHRRGEATLLSGRMTVVLNELFSARGEPYRLPSDGGNGLFQVLRGPLGSGGAVITDQDAEIRAYLRNFNEKCLAVETEAGGLVQAVREDLMGETGPFDWLVVRGISDHADRHKGHRDHRLAARNAATAFADLLPFLRARHA